MKANTQYLDVDGGRIAYDVAGSGPLIVCAPSMGDVRGEYRLLVPQLVQAGFTVASMDLRGLGESSTGWADYSAGPIGADMLALIRHLNRGPAFIIGTSMAAGAAVCAAGSEPASVTGLALVGPFVRDMPANPLMALMYRVLFTDLWGPAAWLKYFATLYPTRQPADSTLTRPRWPPTCANQGACTPCGRWFSPRRQLPRRSGQVRVPVMVVMGRATQTSRILPRRRTGGRAAARYGASDGRGRTLPARRDARADRTAAAGVRANRDEREPSWRIRWA